MPPDLVCGAVGGGPHRKYYAVNEAGRAQLAASAGTWRSFTDAMDKPLGTEEAA
jgi:PadR family transcriptional regulator PadR